MAELAACPFCRAGETLIDYVRNPGIRMDGKGREIISVQIQHWCPRPEGQPQRYVMIAGRTEADAIARWNTRADAPAQTGAYDVAALRRVVEAAREFDSDLSAWFDFAPRTLPLSAPSSTLRRSRQAFRAALDAAAPPPEPERGEKE